MIRATAATWLNYATTLVFQVLFAANFGTSAKAGVYVVAFAAAVSLSGIFITTTTTIALPRMLGTDRSLRKPALTFMLQLGFLVVLIATAIVAGSSTLGSFAATMFHIPSAEAVVVVLFADLFLAASALAGMLAAISLARGHRFLPALAPALPTIFGSAYLLIGGREIGGTMGAVALGALAQAGMIGGLVYLDRPRVSPADSVRLGPLAALTAAQLALFGLLPPLQRLISATTDLAGPVRFDFAFRGITVAQQLLIGGLLIAILPDWAARHRRGESIARDVATTTVAAGHLLIAATGIALVGAPAITALLFQRGAFSPTDTAAVATIVRLLLIGFLSESVALIMLQALLASGRNDVALQVGFGRLVLQAGLTIALGLVLGAAGVALAYSITMALACAYAGYRVRRMGLLVGVPAFGRSVVAWMITGLAAVLVLIIGPAMSPLIGAAVVLVVACVSAISLGLGRSLRPAVRFMWTKEDASASAK